MYAIIDSAAAMRGSVMTLNAILLFSLVCVYFASHKFFLYRYKKRYNQLPPVFNGMFKLYSKNLISNAPSKKEKAYYIATNKFTVVINSLLLVSVFMFVTLCFFN